MRNPSPIRVWNWLAAAGLLVCLFSFAGAQQTPKVGKDPATGHSTKQAQTAEPALHTPVGEGENYLRAREEWFLQDRRLPDGSVGAGMRLKAIEYANQLLEDQRKMGLVPPEGAVAPIEGFLAPTVWTEIGPSPIAVPPPFPSSIFPFFGSPSIAGRVAAIAVNPQNKDVVYLGAAAGGVWKSTDGGLHWTPLTDTQNSLSTGSIALDPSSCTVTDCSTIYVGTGEQNFSGDSYSGAGILKSSDFGSTWTQQGAGVFVGPFSTSRVDGAAHIGALAVDPNPPTGQQVALAGAFFFGAGASSGLYRTTNGGTTWTQTTVAGITGGLPATAILFDPNNVGVVYLALGFPGGASPAGSNAVYRSTDHGATWVKLPGTGSNLFPATTSVGRIALALFPGGLTSTTIYAAVANSNGSTFLGLFKSTDSGTNWTPVTLPADPCSGQCYYDLAIAVDPANPSIIYLGGSAGAFASDGFINSKALVRSTDGGSTWRSVALGATVGVHADLHALVFAADGSRLFVGNDGGAWRTDNPGAALGTLDYTNLNATLAITMHYPGHGTVHFSDQNAGLVGEQDNGSARFSGSTTWDAVFPGGDGGQTAIDPIIPSAVYTTCQFICIFRSLFDGVSNSSYVEVDANGIDPNGTDRVPFIAPLTHDFNTSGRLYFGTDHVYLTTDYGERWDQISPDLTSGSPNVIRAIAAAPSDPNVVYVGTSASGGATPLPSKVQKTINALAGTGATWTDVTNSTVLPTGRGVTSIFVDFNNSSLVYVTYGGFSFAPDTKNHVFRSPDGGATWGDISGNLPNFPINDVFADPDVLNAVFVATDAGVYRTADASLGTSTVWSPLVGTDGKPLPNVIVFSLNGRRSRVLRAATSGRSIFDIQDTSVPIPAGPFASSIRPSSALAGSGTVSGVVLDGANFTATSVVRWNGSTTGITTHLGTANQMTFDIDSTLLASPGVAQIRVFDTSSMLESKKLLFSVNKGGVPTISTLTPNTIGSGSPSFDLTVTGTGFVCAGAGGSGEVLFNGKPHKPTAGNCSPTSMKVTIDSSEVVVSGSVPVMAFAAPPGGGESNTLTFTITSSAGGPDLTIVKSHTGNFTVGGTGTYTFTVTNVGTAPSSGLITATDTFPAGLTPTGASGTGWTCNAVGQVGTCTNPNPIAASASSSFTATVSVGVAAFPSVTNTGTVSGGGDINPNNNSSSDPTTVTAPDLNILKSHTGNFTVGVNGVYSLKVTNVGNADATTTITVSDTLPTGLGFISGTGTGWTCSAVGQVVTCTNPGPLAVSANSTITLTVSVGPAAVPSVTNTATVANANDPNNANNSSSDPTTVTAAPAPDLMMAKSHTGNFLVGVNGTYTLTVTNIGTLATSSVITVTDTLPTGLGFVSGTGTGWTCGAVAQLVTCTNPGPIANGANSVITLTVSVGASAAATVTNTATVSDPGDGNPNGTDKSSTDPTTVNRIDLSMGKSHTGNFFVGTNGIYTLTVTNVGTAATTGTITVTDTLPAGLGFVSGTGTAWICSPVAQVVTCTNPGPLAPSAVSTITLTVSVGAAAASVTNTASVATTNDSNAANDSASDPTTVLNPDLSIVKSHTGSFVVGTTGTYTLTGMNIGTTATGGTITVSDTLPTGLTFVSGTGTGWTCGAAGQVVTCTNPGPLAPTASSAITLVVAVGTAALPSVTNTATVSTPGDTNAANNSSSDITAVTAPDLSLTKTHTGNFTVGVNGTYTLTVTNGGTAATTATITVTDTLPTGLAFVSGTGTGWTCSAVAQVVTCTNSGPLAAAGVSVITLTVGTVSAGTVTNSASVITAGDSNAANNSASDPTTINNPAPTLTSISPNVGNVGQTISMTLTGTGFNSQSVVKFGTTNNTGGTVSNNGTTLTISIPGTELTAAGTVSVTVFNPTPGGGTSAGQNFTISDFTVSSPTGEQTIAAGGSATFTITVATQGGTLANDVTFSVTGLPGASTGTFNPTSFAKGSTGGNSTLTIATTKRGAVPPMKTPRPPRPNPLLWLLAAVLAMMSYSLLRRGWRTRRLALYLPLALLLLSAAFVAGCAGPAGTPVGSSTLTITATSGGVTKTTTVKLNVT